MLSAEGDGFLVKGWHGAGFFLGVAVCNVPFNYEVNVLDYAAFSGTFTVEQGGSAPTPRRWAPWRSATPPTAV